MIDTKSFMFYQHPRYLSALTLGCCHPNNTYSVVNTSTEQEVFKLQEHSSLLTRAFCQPSSRPYLVEILRVREATHAERQASEVLVGYIERENDCKSVIGCCKAPAAKVLTPEGNLLASLRTPTKPCCRIGVQIYDVNGTLNYSIETGGCKCSLMWPSSCLKQCKQTEIEVRKAVGENMLVECRKESQGFKQDCCTSADAYNFQVPSYWDTEELIVFIGALQFFDMLFFERVWAPSEPFGCFV